MEKDREIGTIPSKEEMDEHFVLRHGKKRQEAFSKTKVAICGLGGLGSNIAIALARSGIGSLILIDFDRVDVSNLHRQQYKARQVGQKKTQAMADNLREIAPYIELECFDVRLNEDNLEEYLGGADIICEAFDKADNKAMLVNYVLEKMPDKYLVSASGMAGFGPANDIKTRRISERFYLCGDGKSDVDREGSLVAARVMVCAAHEAKAVLDICCRDGE